MGHIPPANITKQIPEEILQVRSLCKSFAIEQPIWKRLLEWWKGTPPETIEALSFVDLNVRAQETLGILGESGSGKSTLARVLMGLYAPDGGTAKLFQRDLFSSDSEVQLQNFRQMQMIFQDPFGSLDPRMTIRQILEEPLRIHTPLPRSTWLEKLVTGLHEVGLEPEVLGRYPAEFSGGQRQRIGICRALILDPSLVIADEAVSALDVSVQAQILDLLVHLKKARNLSMVFISHDVAVVRQLADRITVLYRGRVVETLPSDCLLQDATHPYTRHLLASALELREGIPSQDIPHTEEIPHQGCPCERFCEQALPVCEKRPVLQELHTGHYVACWRVEKRKEF